MYLSALIAHLRKGEGIQQRAECPVACPILVLVTAGIRRGGV